MSWIVFTGDIVDSTALSPRELEHAFTGLSNATRAMGHLVDDIIWVRRGGDGWQMALTASQTPISPLRAALVIAAHFVAHGSATRIAAAEGDAKLPANRDLNTAHGPVFQASGRLLDEIPSGQWLDHAAGGAVGTGKIARNLRHGRCSGAVIRRAGDGSFQKKTCKI